MHNRSTNDLLFHAMQRKPKHYPWYLVGCAIGVGIILVVWNMYAIPAQCSTDTECYEQCMARNSESSKCEDGLMNP
jgi:hypothetical protein